MNLSAECMEDSPNNSVNVIRTGAKEALDYIRLLYQIEREIKHEKAEQRAILRVKHSKPILVTVTIEKV